MIDSHIHLSYRYYDQTFPYIDYQDKEICITYGNRDHLITEMKKLGIQCCIEPAIDVDSNELLLCLSEEYDGFIYPSVGNHPTRCISSPVKDFSRVRNYSKNERIVAIGETGLDYHLERRAQHRLKQKVWFQWQINLAHEKNLPLILHIRKADKDAIKILRKNKGKLHGGVCHCFCSGLDQAKVYTEELGMCLGIGGTLLMKQEISSPLQQVVTEIPLKYLLLETDGPYVKPERPDHITSKKWNKARNSSLILPIVANKIAELRGVSVEKVLATTTENTKRLFGIDN